MSDVIKLQEATEGPWFEAETCVKEKENSQWQWAPGYDLAMVLFDVLIFNSFLFNILNTLAFTKVLLEMALVKL